MTTKQSEINSQKQIIPKKMIKKALVLVFLFIGELAYNQVGIGTTNPHASSMLEINSANKGILIPRIALNSSTDATTIPSPATGLLIYNNQTVSDVTPGFYYWEGSWKKLMNSGSSSSGGWSLSGNLLATGSEYIGTNNYNSLLFKVNNNLFAKFHPNGGIAIGNSSSANDNSSIAIGTQANASASNQAIALGYATNASGFQSTSIGLQASSTANATVALGNNATASGFQSNSIGFSANSNTNNALAVGNYAVASGQQATALGTEATASGQNATAIGYQASATQANSIILGNATNTNNKVGIGTNTPDERLHIAGAIKIVDGNQANNYVLTSDATGKAAWKDPNATKSFGEIYRASDLTLTSGAINFGNSGVSQAMTLSSNYIQVQTDGTYKITYTVSLKKNAGSTVNLEFYLGIWGVEIPNTRSYITLRNGDAQTISMTKIVTLSAWQGIGVLANAGDSNVVIKNNSNLIIELLK